MSDGNTIRITANGTPTVNVELSRKEAWRLYVLLADGAPFVRHALRAVPPNNGIGTVSLSTPQERQHVLEALLRGSTTRAPLSNGLQALAIALKAINLPQGTARKR